MARALVRLTLIGLYVTGSVVFHGCGKPFNVKSRVDLPVAPAAAAAQFGDASLRAHAIEDEDLLFDTFDANLIQAGLIPVNLSATNQGLEPVSFDRVRFELRDSTGSKYQRLNARKAYKRLISYYEISTYNKRGYRSSLEEFCRYEFDAGTLAAGERRTGLLFFSSGRAPATGPLVLTVKARGLTAELELDRKGG
jgi:hypothetical protein